MNNHVGASFTLSVLVVIFFAVVLYPAERVPPAPRAPGPPTSGSSKPSPTTGPRPETTPGVPLDETATVPAAGPPHVAAFEPGPTAPVPSPERSEERPDPPRRVQDVVIPTSPPPRIRAVSRTRAISLPRSAFTQVGDRETLDDVALRVYGTTEEVQLLWLANRDLINRKDAPLRAGMLLRTP